MNLSPHFTLDELCHSEYASRMRIDNTPPDGVMNNLRVTALRLEIVRKILGKPIVVSSGFRAPQVNAGVGGSRKSAHLTGQAADILVPGFGRPDKVVAELRKHFRELAYDQLIIEYPKSPSGGWTHIGFADTPRGEVLEYNGKEYIKL